MKIIEPKVELMQYENKISHVANCARVCYKKETGNDDILCNNLIKRNHLSMFRHITYYYIVPIESVPDWAYNILKAKQMGILIVGIDIYNTGTKYYIVVNGHWCIEHFNYIDYIKSFEVNEKEFANDSEIAWNMIRYTFKITTQISTSRELNRVSPNNIAEQSTRYVYEDGTICRPHWLEGYNISQTLHGKYLIYKDGKEDDDINHKVLTYIQSCDSSFNNYKYLVDAGLYRQDARGVLPLDTATRCVYTYSVDEWRAIIDLRYYGTTGKPHPNAKLIAGMIREKLMNLGYDFR